MGGENGCWDGWKIVKLVKEILQLSRNFINRKMAKDKSLQIELVTKYDTNDALQESLAGASKSAKRGPYLLTDFERTFSVDFKIINGVLWFGCKAFTDGHVI